MSSTKEPRRCNKCKKLSDFDYFRNDCDWCGEEFTDYIDDGYEYDNHGNALSCCGEFLDPDIMICPVCKEHN